MQDKVLEFHSLLHYCKIKLKIIKKEKWKVEESNKLNHIFLELNNEEKQEELQLNNDHLKHLIYMKLLLYNKINKYLLTREKFNFTNLSN